MLYNTVFKIAAIKEISLVDVLGFPSFVLWFPYCNFRCPWCQNWKIVKGEDIRLMSLKEILELIEESKVYIDYVQVTGGEPTLHREQLIALFQAVKELGLKTSLNTNGSITGVIKELYSMGILDHVAMDIKAPLEDAELYYKVIGIRAKKFVENIKASLAFLIENLDFLELRTTIVPNLIGESELFKIGKLLMEYGCDKNCHWVIQQFVPAPDAPDPKYREGERTDVDYLIFLAKKIKDEVGIPRIYVRSMEKGVTEV